MITAILFLLVLSALVFVHELGHFLAARFFGIRVDEFFIGFPPRLYSKVIGKTRYGLNWLPFGGYVRIHGENPDDEHTPDNILSKPRYQQIVVLIAGVAFNVIFAWLLLSLALVIGTRTSSDGFAQKYISDPSVVIDFVLAGSPAAEGGLKPGDEIINISNFDTSIVLATTSLSIASIQGVVADSPSVYITYKEPVAEKDASTTSNVSSDAYGGKYQIKSVRISPVEGLAPGRTTVGISMNNVGLVKVHSPMALIYGAKETFYLTENIFFGLVDFFKSIFVGKADFSQVSGPVGIAGIVGQATTFGFAYLLTITSVISVNLAIINLLPFPAIDGGRILVVIIEAIIDRPLKHKIINIINLIGFALLMLLMLVVTFKDVFNLFK